METTTTTTTTHTHIYIYVSSFDREDNVFNVPVSNNVKESEDVLYLFVSLW
jgi:hypothetical protein